MKRFSTSLAVLLYYLFSLSHAAAAPASQVNFKIVNPRAAEVDRKVMQLAPGLNFKIGQYIQETNLTRQQRFAPLFTPGFASRFLRSPASYNEVVEGLSDRLRVTRTIQLDFKDPCDVNLPREQSFCFQRTNRPFDIKVKDDLKGMRTKIKRRLASTRDSVEQGNLKRILAMNDSQLLDYVLNKSSTSKTITHTSFVPFSATRFGAKSTLDLSKVNRKIPRQLMNLPGSTQTMTASGEIEHTMEYVPVTQNQNEPEGRRGYTFNSRNRYSSKIVTGYRYERNYSDTYVVTFVRESWWHDRYYASFSYNLYYDIGFQFPFELKVDTAVNRVYQRNSRMQAQYPADTLCKEVSTARDARLCAAAGVATVQAYPVSQNRSTRQFYREAGVAGNMVTDEEFVFKVGASCRLYASIPGPDISRNCPGSTDIDYSQHFRPSLGSQSSDFQNFFIPRSMARSIPLGIDLGITYAILRPGIALRGHGGSLTFTLVPELSRFQSDRSSVVLGNSPVSFQLSENVREGTSEWGFSLKDVKYTFNASLLPKIKAEVGIGVANYNWSHTFGPYALDALEFDLGSFNFERLPGTPRKHTFFIGTRRES